MDSDPKMLIWLVPGLGMMIVAGAAAVCWQRVSHAPIRWLWVGAGLWTVAVALKFTSAILTSAAVMGFLKEHLPYFLLVVAGGLYAGIQSSVFEMGFTLLAVLIWRQLGRDAKRAIAIGVGAGAFEAFLLGLVTTIAMVVTMAGMPGTEKIRAETAAVAAVTPLFWVVAPVERVIAVLCHASTRALILLGAVHRNPAMVFWGFLIFTLLDGVAGAFVISGKMGTFSVWWIELAVLPFVLVSVPILRWCYVRWRAPAEFAAEPTVGAPPDAPAEAP